MLVDRGFISGALVEAMRARGAHVLGRLPQGVFPHKEQVTPSRMQSGSSATNPQVRQVHRLITTLLSSEQARAEALCLC